MGLVEMLREELPKYKFHALALAGVAALALSLIRVGPSFLTVVSFFWPLFLSTAFFLAAVLVLRIISPPPAGGETGQTGEDFMDYVASHGSLGGHSEAQGSTAEGREEEEEEEEAAAAAAGAGDRGAEVSAAEETKKSQ